MAQRRTRRANAIQITPADKDRDYPCPVTVTRFPSSKLSLRLRFPFASDFICEHLHGRCWL